MKSYPQLDRLTGIELDIVSPLGETVKARLHHYEHTSLGPRGWRILIPTFGMDVHESYLRQEGWTFPETELLEINANQVLAETNQDSKADQDSKAGQEDL